MLRFPATKRPARALLALPLLNASRPAWCAEAERDARENAEADAVTARQSVDAFCSIQDGRPGDAGRIEGEANLGLQTGFDDRDPVILTGIIKYTPESSGLLRGTEWSRAAPITRGAGGGKANGDLVAIALPAWTEPSRPSSRGTRDP